MLTPYELYLKIAYHLGTRSARWAKRIQAAAPNLSITCWIIKRPPFGLPRTIFNTRDGVLLGDVVGLGKTLMATALAKIFQDDHSWDTLIICPPNLQQMWQKYVDDYRLIAKVISLGMVTNGIA